MPNIRKDRSVSDAMATQTLREKASRLVFQPMQQALEETLGSCAVPPVSRQDAPHDAVPRRLATYGERLRSRAAAMPPREPGLAKLAFVGLQLRLRSSPAAFAAILEVHLKEAGGIDGNGGILHRRGTREERNRKPKGKQYWRSNETRTPRRRLPLHMLCPSQIGMQW